jgi:penicillin-binding protein 1A
MAVLAAANRRPVKLDQISKHLIHATIAVEDARFYHHRGVDYLGIVRALIRNLTGGDIRGQGASTITQQLARNIETLGVGRKKVLDRKLREAVLARRIEELFTKDEILELYLNTIYYGNGAYGAEAASQAYFRKPASELTLSQAAYLAGIPQRPVYYSQNRDAAMARRDVVLGRMVAAGYITPQQRDEAAKEPIEPHKAVVTGSRIYGAPYFVDYVVRELQRLYGPEKARSGLSVYTTLDSRMQNLAEDVIKSGVRESGYANQGCLVSMDNQTGFIRAMVGGVDYDRDQFNIVTQGLRQPGSSFKPIVYTAAIDTGVCDLNSRFRDDPNFPWRGHDKWVPKNYGGRYSYSSVTVRDAIRRSLNTVAVKVAVQTGIDVVIQYARTMGITTDLEPYAPLALGASAVHPMELCVAYSVFANEGKRIQPMGIFRVMERNGLLLDEFSGDKTDTGIQPATMQQMNEALREVVLHGTGTAAASVPEARGKTGTTDDNRDAWFAGYTPELSTVVWVAREKRQGKRVLYLSMPGATGGKLCAPIWRNFMQKAVDLEHEATQREARRKAEETPPPRKTPEEKAAEQAQSQSEPPANGTDNATQSPSETEPGAVEPPPLPPVPSEPIPPSGPGRSQPSAERSHSATRTEQPPAPARPDPGSEIVRVRLCAETGMLATLYCNVTIERNMPRRDVPPVCRKHRPPPGEGR